MGVITTLAADGSYETWIQYAAAVIAGLGAVGAGTQFYAQSRRQQSQEAEQLQSLRTALDKAAQGGPVVTNLGNGAARTHQDDEDALGAVVAMRRRTGTTYQVLTDHSPTL
jgi:hypothetical protein